jgi:hypothetical protein
MGLSLLSLMGFKDEFFLGFLPTLPTTLKSELVLFSRNFSYLLISLQSTPMLCPIPWKLPLPALPGTHLRSP